MNLNQDPDIFHWTIPMEIFLKFCVLLSKGEDINLFKIMFVLLQVEVREVSKEVNWI